MGKTGKRLPPVYREASPSMRSHLELTVLASFMLLPMMFISILAAVAVFLFSGSFPYYFLQCSSICSLYCSPAGAGAHWRGSQPQPYTRDPRSRHTLRV